MEERIKELEKKNKELEKENKDLKRLCDRYEEEHTETFRIWKEVLDEHTKEKALIESIQKIISAKSQSATWKYNRIVVLVRDCN